MGCIRQQDAIRFLQTLGQRPRLILTDPPYGIRYQTNMPGDRRWNKSGKSNNRFPRLMNDHPGAIDFCRFFQSCYDVLADDGFLSVFAHWRTFGDWSRLMGDAGFSLRTPIIWNKLCANGGDLNDPVISAFECVIRASKGSPESYPLFNRHGELKKRVVNVWDHGRTPKAEYCGHPTQKPLYTCEQLIRMATTEGDLVVDPFCGVGSTLVAAKNLGREYAGCDVDGKFVQLAMRRIRDSSVPSGASVSNEASMS